jgi:hypothetical protein
LLLFLPAVLLHSHWAPPTHLVRFDPLCSFFLVCMVALCSSSFLSFRIWCLDLFILFYVFVCLLAVFVEHALVQCHYCQVKTFAHFLERFWHHDMTVWYWMCTKNVSNNCFCTLPVKRRLFCLSFWDIGWEPLIQCISCKFHWMWWLEPSFLWRRQVQVCCSIL